MQTYMPQATATQSSLLLQMLQPDNMSQLSAPSTNAIANVLGLTPNLGLAPADSAQEPAGSHLT